MKTIDMHAHYVAPELIEEVTKEGARHHITVLTSEAGNQQFSVAGRLSPPLPFAITKLEERFATMQAERIDVQLISTQIDLSGYNLEPQDGLWFCALQNETLAATASRYPEKLAAMATVPLQAPELAAQELKRAIGSLHMHGVEIGTSVNNVYLDALELDVFWQTAQDLDVPIFLHPLDIQGTERLQEYYLNILLGFPTETSIAATRLMLSGVLTRFPRLKICLAHAGGVLPYLAGRIDRGYTSRAEFAAQSLKELPSRMLQRFYFDTIAHADSALQFLYEMVGPEQIILGTDYPFEVRDPYAVTRVEKLTSNTQEARAQILGGTTAAIFHLD